MNAVPRLLLVLVSLTAGLVETRAQVFIPPQPPMYQPQFPPYGYNQPPQYQRAGGRCATQAGICLLQGLGPVGQGCACQTPMGPIYGQIVP